MGLSPSPSDLSLNAAHTLHTPIIIFINMYAAPVATLKRDSQMTGSGWEKGVVDLMFISYSFPISEKTLLPCKFRRWSSRDRGRVAGCLTLSVNRVRRDG